MYLLQQTEQGDANLRVNLNGREIRVDQSTEPYICKIMVVKKNSTEFD